MPFQEEISEDDEGDAVDVIGGAFADGPRARRQRRAALRAQRAPRRRSRGGAPFWGVEEREKNI